MLRARRTGLRAQVAPSLQAADEAAAGLGAACPPRAATRAAARLDRMPTARVVALLLDEDRRAARRRRRASAARSRAPRTLAADALEARRARSCSWARAPAAGSGVLEAAECPPTFGSDPDRIRGVMAGGEGAVFRAVEGAEDREDDGRREGRRAADAATC